MLRISLLLDFAFINEAAVIFCFRCHVSLIGDSWLSTTSGYVYGDIWTSGLRQNHPHPMRVAPSNQLRAQVELKAEKRHSFSFRTGIPFFSCLRLWQCQVDRTPLASLVLRLSDLGWATLVSCLLQFVDGFLWDSVYVIMWAYSPNVLSHTSVSIYFLLLLSL
jgi:hypothetical protein